MKVKEPLEQRINDLADECRRFVRDRAIEVSKGSGVPAISNEMMLMQAGDGSPFYAALRVIETLKREREIADREWQKEHAARQSA